MKIAFVGGGNMALSLIGGLIGNEAKAEDILVIDPSEDACSRAQESHPGIQTLALAGSEFSAYEAVVLAVKPQAAAQVSRAVAPYLKDSQLIISIIAGIRSDDLSRWLGGHTRIVRCMPNTPALIGKGVSGLAATPSVDTKSRILANRLLTAVGSTVWVDEEEKIDAVTAISGSGPAYVFYFIEALQEAAARLGLDKEQGRALAITTFEGAAQLASNSNESPSILRERVTSKGGTTAAALASFDSLGVKESIIQGAIAANRRAMAMADEFSKAD